MQLSAEITASTYNFYKCNFKNKKSKKEGAKRARLATQAAQGRAPAALNAVMALRAAVSFFGTFFLCAKERKYIKKNKKIFLEWS